MGQSAIRGRIVTMDAAGTVLADGVVYIARCRHRRRAPGRPGAARPGSRPSAACAPAGTVYPGLIELHNHLSYNCLQLWQVPRPFTNRGQWSDRARTTGA